MRLSPRARIAVDPAPTAGAGVRSWRATTAVRTCGLALATGMLLADGELGAAGPLLAALALIAGVTSGLEWGTPARSTPWIPVGEAALVAILLMTAESHAALLPYLAVPGVVAGVRHGWMTTLNASSVGIVTVLATLQLDAGSVAGERLSIAVPWLAIGVGMGLLATWQSRSLRVLESRQAPYAAAHQMMTQLHDLARRGALGLDSAQLAADLGADLRRRTGAVRSAVFTLDSTHRPGVLLASHGDIAGLTDPGSSTGEDAEVAVVPLRGVNGNLGAVALGRPCGWTPDLVRAAQQVADEQALRLDTAVLFDDVRLMATAEERNRIAREMHDGVAQEIVALGYVVDEIESISGEAEVRDVAGRLREELSRVVTELRLSIFDLRHGLGGDQLAGALAEYVREVSHGSDLRVHLTLDESGPGLAPRVQTELLRVAQEAIGNVRKHAGAQNLWVTLVADGALIALHVEDDGVGNASPKRRHFGLDTMRERAERIGADLTIEPRPAGGTIVRLLTRSNDTPEGKHAS